ncbi:UDP-glucose 4-epimerase GalE [Aliidiomarina indica]|uniref:UDP-glucose 4-epimerase GalE n=1 Tax=Aliidiomarina indica TaxID=2749147 RepID=UPI00188F6BEC|nr:UDP-glucose 4-epimerase GalE [Aliidiomarina indica]
MILVTGGAGYIGSHIVVELANAGYDFLVFDNFSNSSPTSIERVSKLTGCGVKWIQGDVRSHSDLNRVFSEYSITAVLHLAGLKIVSESIEKPLEYYDNNVRGSLCLLEVMGAHGVKRIVFSSSAAVYGESASMPITENAATGNTSSPYGASKYIVEQRLQELCHSDPQWSAFALRYFNPVGAHPTGLIGEENLASATNIFPSVIRVAQGLSEYFEVYGNDYHTPDGTGIRDYIHVVDLARGHIDAISAMTQRKGFHAFNLGTGRGYSVLEVLQAFEKHIQQTIPYRFLPRRDSDISESYAASDLAEETLGWKANFDLVDMVQDVWQWTTNTTTKT